MGIVNNELDRPIVCREDAVTKKSATGHQHGLVFLPSSNSIHVPRQHSHHSNLLNLYLGYYGRIAKSQRKARSDLRLCKVLAVRSPLFITNDYWDARMENLESCHSRACVHLAVDLKRCAVNVSGLVLAVHLLHVSLSRERLVETEMILTGIVIEAFRVCSANRG